MLFNSYTYVLAFLPIALVVFHGLRSLHMHRASLLSLVGSSLFFYGWWNPVYLLLLIPLTLANYAIAIAIARHRVASRRTARALMAAGVTGNLLVLAYFKYANFLVANVDALFGLEWVLGAIVLPLGISFFTFQKIAYLVDSYRGKVDHYDLLEFALFVSFFPQLIAGPIVHHSEVLPQFRKPSLGVGTSFSLGVTMFTIGLAKKVLLADNVAPFVAPAFAAAAAGAPIGAWGAWTGALAYTVQLYFDFSGYSDMAIGAALLFGVRFPLNFDSPYKATSITDFWRRWHMTLSRFLRDYLYIPLGGNRHGEFRRYANLLATMVLGGFWHGANWTFLLWGMLHGIYLTINHGWQQVRGRLAFLPAKPRRVEAFAGRLLTFLAVVAGWVFFRAPDAATAVAMLAAMAGANGSATSAAVAPGVAAVETLGVAAFVATLLAMSWYAPNSQQITGFRGVSATPPTVAADPQPPKPWRWRPTLGWSIATGCLFALALMSLSKVSEFLYFQF